MAFEEIRVILITGVTVGGAIAGVAMWAFRSIVAKDVTPVIVELRTEAKALTREFVAFREVKEDERKETTAILRDLEKLVSNIEARVTVLEKRA